MDGISGKWFILTYVGILEAMSIARIGKHYD